MSTWETVVDNIPSSFCPRCGAYLILSIQGDITCEVCGLVIKGNTFKYEPIETTSSNYQVNSKKHIDNKIKEILPTGAIVYEKCPACGNETMHYHSAQVRSVDEGQTVYYECPNCGHQETINT
ncbi:DNA-directed RNA polymerase I subunit RPA12, putative [Entamoeba invadens IP1]|uniref:DNA-directed RNA polymerase I subunit RPA12, putative n=1 Tax=Entamoeba invadens IP1 TaxID=370355 RepID=UPI0002C3E567|nr:DNA-directed RNA polymerase I subunit RPA12, putative [Entamoeba invadens IP1]ELP90754.1 DNA-directed RNA polymerase I subunit RPA12, putative [Entamoeba invadens IP1]|eukprot:XP_004257525.1 DNA-directed RNA polymerase I subunit RPA12, putative [Entamoeba invadens IP1]